MKHETAIPIGSGGMGEVFKAWDPSLERYVALKYLRHDDPVLVERLMREARAQARVDHPSVCKVYEVGEDDDRPFIAMEYVDGVPLDIAAAGLSVEQKVLLVEQVTDAVQAAHSAGLIHRDLKPANILVADRDGRPHPFVLDFGIARLEEVVGLTMTGQVMGTPGYLSPEQARGEVATLDRRTDVFSLGVVLYELLGGARPFPGDSNVEILMRLIEDEPEPLRKMAPKLPKDLETVVMTCLEKDPDRRYPSAKALADDLGRFLDGEPVEARPIGVRERLVRRARKNPVAASALAAAALALIALAVVSVGGWVKYTADLKRERDVAEAREAEAREIADFMVGVFSSSDPDEAEGETVTAREILDRGAERIENELGGRPETQARLLGIMGEVYSGLGLYDRSLPLLERALAQVTALPGHTAAAELEARVRLADLCANRNELDRAAELLAPVLGMISSAPDLDPAVAAQALGSIGRVHLSRGEYVEGGEVLTQAIELAERTLGPDAPLVGDLVNDRIYYFHRQKMWDLAIADGRRALEIRERHYGPDDPRVGTTLSNLALALNGSGRFEEAAAIGERVLELRERTLGPDHPRTTTAINNLGLTYKKMGRLDRAEELYLRALEIRTRTLGELHPRVAALYNNIAGVYFERGDLDLAKATYRKAIEISEATLGPDHPDVALCMSGLSLVAEARGQYAEVERLALRGLAIRENAFGPDSPNLVGVLRKLGESLLAQDRLDEATASLERGRRIAVTAYGEEDKRVAQIDAVLAEVEKARVDGSPR